MTIKLNRSIFLIFMWGVVSGAVDAAPPLVDLSPKTDEFLTRLIQSEVQGWGDVDTTAPKVQKNVECFGGFTTFSLSGISYEVFPSLGFYRVMTLQGEPKWLLMDLALKPEEVVIAKGHNFAIKKNLNDRISACGSGMLGKDISAAQFSCARIDRYRVVVIKVSQNDGKITLAKILLDNNDEVSAMTVGKIWKLGK